MELEFLTVGDYQHKELYLKHINEMINIKLTKGDTYNTLFTKLRKEFNDSPKRLQAVEDWIKLNIDQQDDVSVFDTILCEVDDDENGCYASFNLSK